MSIQGRKAHRRSRRPTLLERGRSPSAPPLRSLGYRPMGATLQRSGGASPGQLSGRVGAEVRLLRKRLGITIVELSQKSGQSTGFLSQIERGISIPSVSAIESIAVALGVRVTWFFEAGEVVASSEGEVVVRKENRRRLTYATGIDDQLLSPQLNGPLEMFLATFSPGSGNGEGWLVTTGYQAGMVIEGQLRLLLDAETYDLKAGDSFGFDGSVRHRYVNPGRSNALIIWAFTRPDT